MQTIYLYESPIRTIPSESRDSSTKLDQLLWTNPWGYQKGKPTDYSVVPENLISTGFSTLAASLLKSSVKEKQAWKQMSLKFWTIRSDTLNILIQNDEFFYDIPLLTSNVMSKRAKKYSYSS